MWDSHVSFILDGNKNSTAVLAAARTQKTQGITRAGAQSLISLFITFHIHTYMPLKANFEASTAIPF
jgi:hypothetical protein